MVRNHLTNGILRAGGFARRVIALVLLLCLVIPIFVPPVQASGIGEHTTTPVANTYLLRVDTGVNSGELVQYIAIRYEDSSNVCRTHFIFPHSGSMQEGFDLASQYGSVQSRLDLTKRITHYSPADMNNRDSLQPNGHDEFLFSPYFPFKKLLSVDVYQSYKDGGKGWTCAGMEFFKVSNLYGMTMAGYYSSDYFVEFDGELQYSYPDPEIEKVHDFTLSTSDDLAILGADVKSKYQNKNMVDRRNAKYSTGSDQEFIFEINIADVYEAGIEALAIPVADHKPTLENFPTMEFLNLNLTYEDTSGLNHTVQLPIITSTLAWAVENNLFSSSVQLAGIAQQGENLVFAGRLPGFKSLVKYQLNYDLDADNRCNIVRDGGIDINGTHFDDPKAPFRTHMDESGAYVADYVDLRKDRMSLTGFKLYCVAGKGADSVSYIGNDTALFFATSLTPSYFYTTATAYGDSVSPGTPKTVRMENMNDYDPTEVVLDPVFDLTNRYIVQITTDNMSFAETADDIQAVFHYTSTSGTSKSTNPFVLRDAINEFYGYWPGENGAYAYSYATGKGNTMNFFLDIPELASFEAVDLYMPSTSTDDWQLKSIAIYKPAWVGKRSVKWQDHAASGNTTDRIYYRDFDQSEGTRMRFYGSTDEEPVYINGSSNDDNKHRIDFDITTEEERDKPDIDWTDKRFSLTYKEALQDFGFTKVRATYEVQVKVAGNENATDDSGDCGSDNLFFFQLIFENGSSGFVLANQQLTADGFRAGQIESFVIQTNQDYGELSSVRVLPSDVDEENDDVFDKLKIDYINVVKKNNASLSRTWKAENVGWIEIDYSDHAAENSVLGKKARSYDQIARDFPITYNGYTQNLLFVLSTGPYAKEYDVNGLPVEGADEFPPLEGSVTATIYYNDGSPGIREKSVDIVRAMYEYAGKAPVNDPDTGFALIDTASMMRANHQDRFFVSLENVRKITGIRLEVHGKSSTTWRINSVCAYEIKAEGSLKINTDNEYQRHYPKDLELITESDEDFYTIKSTHDGTEQKQTIDFKDNTIDVNISEGVWTSTITREPVNRNDTINLYIHTRNDPTATPISRYELKATLNYHDKNSDDGNALVIRNFKKSTDDGLFYALQLPASGLCNVSRLELKTNSAEAVTALMDYAIVQHVRSGVVIGSYFIDFDGGNAENGISSTPSEGTRRLDNQMQTVQLFFAQDTVTANLSEEKTDIAVAIRYTSTNDPSGTEYTSPYVFLTDPLQPDSEQIKYRTVRPALVAELNFHEDFVKNITGVQIVQVGNLSTNIASAVAAQYNIAGDKPQLTNWYSFADGHVLSHSPCVLTPTTTNVVPVEIDLHTALAIDGMDVGTGTNDAIRMTVSYTNMQNSTTKEITIPDIRKYLTGGSFASGDTATIRFFLKDVGQIRSVSLEPHSGTGLGKTIWDLDTITVRMLRSGVPQVLERSFTGSEGLIMEGEPKVINLTNIVISTLTSYYNSKVKQQNAVNSNVEGKTNILLYSGDSAAITVTLEGSLPGYGYSVEAVMSRDGATTQVNCFSRTGNKIAFTPPRNYSGTDDVYIVTIRSDENPNVTATVEIHLESEPEPEPEPQLTPTPQENPPADNGGT